MGIAFDIKGIKDLLRFEYEAQRKQILLLLPVFLAFGIGLYFSLPVEPPIALGGVGLLSSFFLYIFFKDREPLLPLFVFMLALGFCAAQLRTHSIHTPILQDELGPVGVVGTITEIEDLGDEAGSRLILSDLDIERLEADQTPRKIRLKLWKDEGLRVGQRVSALAKIHPPSPPVIPGGFDFQRHLYFKGIGGVGFIFKEAEVLEDAAPSIFDHTVEKWRQTIALRIEEATSYPEAAIVMALMIGSKTAIAQDDKEAMRAAGLAHMLAISGLHVGLFSGALFFLARLFMAFVPVLALKHPIKKYATVFAIIGAGLYMLLAGATIPTVRAVLMTSIVFLAIILDRSPISLRLVGFAAFVVLLFFPESLLSASFHLSFAAVTALVAFYSWLRPFWSQWYGHAGWLRRAGLYFLGVCLTTMIATLATAPFALFHFHQLASYGLLGNVLAMPILAFVIMPSILASLVLMPLGLEWVSLMFSELGVRAILDVAHWVSDLPSSVLKVPMWSDQALILIVLSGLMVILLGRVFKPLAVIPLALSILFIYQYSQYDILISSSNKLVSFWPSNGQMYVSDLRKDRFTRQNWAESYGLDDGAVNKWPKEKTHDFMSCDEQACRIQLKKRTISYVYEEAAAKTECGFSDVVIASFPVQKCQAGIVIDLFKSKRDGVHGIRISDWDISVDSSVIKRGKRPWSSANSTL